MLSNSLLATAAAVDKLEADALRSPLTVRSWVQLIRAVDDFNIDPLNNDDSSDVNLADMFARFNRLNEIFERSLLHNPYSYKLWVTYLNHRIGQWGALSKLSLTTNSTPPHLRLWNGIVRVFERALERLPNMPLLWTNFLEFVACENVPEAARNVIPTMFTKFRVSLIDALQALPITQHALVWNVFRKWTATLRLDAAPFASLHSLWQLHLKGNTSDRVMGEYVQFLVKCQRNDALLQYLCSLGQWSAVQAKWTLPKLCQDSVFWDLIGGVLLSPSHNAKAPQQQQQQQQKVSPHDSLPVDSEKLIRFVLLGTSHSLQPDRLVLSLAVYLMRRGSFLEARSVLSNVLQTTTNTSTFQDAFVALVRMEEQLIDCVTLDDSAVTRFSSETELLNFLNARVFSVKSKETVGGEFNPLHGLTTLVRDYPLLLNAVQLRQKPHDARLWLKRVECLYERAAANGVASTDPSVVADVEHVLTQGVTLCKRNQAQFAADGLTHDEQQSRGELHDVSALYLAWSDLLVSLQRWDEALELLKKATFAVAYSSTAMNAVLFGRLVEVLCLTSQNTSNPAGFAHSEESVKATFLTSMMAIIRGELDQWSEWKRERTANGGAAGSQQQRRVTASSMFLGQRGGAALKVLSAPELWTTAWDVVFWAEGAAGPHGEELSRWMSALGLYTPSIALGRASRLREKKLYLDSFLVLEDALNRCHQSSTEGAVAALELADAAAATVIEHMQHNLHNSFVSPLNEEDILEGQSSLRQLQILAGSTQQQPPTEMNKALFTEKLRGVLRQGLAAARVCASSSAAGEHHVHQAMVFFFTAAACEEYLGLYGHCIATLLDATRTFHTRMCKRSKAATLQKQQRSSAAVDESGAPVLMANEQQVGEDTEANAKAQLIFMDESLGFLKCVETYSCKLLQLRGNTMFFSEVASLLKWTLSPRSQSEIALRLTAELTKARLIDKCRAVFTTLAPTQNPAERSGELFWGAWATFERDFGVEATFTSCQRTKRNVLAAFSKSEVKFENQ